MSWKRIEGKGTSKRIQQDILLKELTNRSDGCFFWEVYGHFRVSWKGLHWWKESVPIHSWWRIGCILCLQNTSLGCLIRVLINHTPNCHSECASKVMKQKWWLFTIQPATNLCSESSIIPLKGLKHDEHLSYQRQQHFPVLCCYYPSSFQENLASCSLDLLLTQLEAPYGLRLRVPASVLSHWPELSLSFLSSIWTKVCSIAGKEFLRLQCERIHIGSFGMSLGLSWKCHSSQEQMGEPNMYTKN